MKRDFPTEFIPCPRCMGPSELQPAAPGELARSKCFAGHEHSLSPEVLTTLREIAKRAERRMA